MIFVFIIIPLTFFLFLMAFALDIKERILFSVPSRQTRKEFLLELKNKCNKYFILKIISLVLILLLYFITNLLTNNLFLVYIIGYIIYNLSINFYFYKTLNQIKKSILFFTKNEQN